MEWLTPVAMLLHGLATLYLIGGVGSLAFRSIRLAFERKWKLSLLCVIYALTILLLALLFSRFSGSIWPQPMFIPLYAGYIALSNYLANVAPKKWLIQSAAVKG